jgi:hypothetical protein
MVFGHTDSVPKIIHRVPPACQAICAAGTDLKGSVPMSLLPLLASLVIAGAGCTAFAAIAVTVRAQLPAVRKVLADSRAIAADRAFLFQITAVDTPVAPRTTARPPRMPVRSFRSAPIALAKPLRAAA